MRYRMGTFKVLVFAVGEASVQKEAEDSQIITEYPNQIARLGLTADGLQTYLLMVLL